MNGLILVPPNRIRPSDLAHAVTVLFVGQVWAGHRVMFDHLREADRVVPLDAILARPAGASRQVSGKAGNSSRFDHGSSALAERPSKLVLVG